MLRYLITIFRKRSFGSGHATLTLRPDWQKHLVQAVSDLGLGGVRHHGLLDDDMRVVTAPGVYNFSKVRIHIDIDSRGRLPYVHLEKINSQTLQFI